MLKNKEVLQGSQDLEEGNGWVNSLIVELLAA